MELLSFPYTPLKLERVITLAPSETVAEAGHSPHRRFVFGEFEMDLDRGSLKRCGGEVPLRPKSFAMLQYLIEHAGQLVSRESLLELLWPGVIVSDDAVAQCLIEIRRALGDDERSMIRTVPRRGLIFNVPVRREEAIALPATAAGTPAARRRDWRLGVALAAVLPLLLWWWAPWEPAGGRDERPASTPAEKSIAVLRFTDMSGAGDHSYLGDGLSEEIMHALAQSPSLRVIARASSFAVEGLPIAAIADQLGVSHVLEGSVRRQGDDLRVTAQLIDAESSTHIWSQSYDRSADDLLEVQREIAGAVAGKLNVSITDSDAMSGIDPRAYEQFLEGRFFLLRRADGDAELAQERFESAVSISPSFARAWTGLSAAAAVRLSEELKGPVLTPVEREQILETWRYAAEQALRFGPDLPEAHLRAATIFFYSGDPNRARRHFEIARSIDPDHWLVGAHLAAQLKRAGRIEESLELVRRGVQRDPLNIVGRENLVTYLVWAGRFDEARAELRRILELMPSLTDDSWFTSHAARVQVLTGDFQAAANSAESVSDPMLRAELLALAWHGLGREEEARAAIEKITSAPATPWRALYAAEVLAWRGESAGALEWLRGIEIEMDNCDDRFVREVYYSPFLAKLSGIPEWEEYRAGVLDVMKECFLGLEDEEI